MNRQGYFKPEIVKLDAENRLVSYLKVDKNTCFNWWCLERIKDMWDALWKAVAVVVVEKVAEVIKEALES